MVTEEGEGLDCRCLRWWALEREAEAASLRVCNRSEDGCLVKMGERGRVMVLGEDDDDEVNVVRERRQSMQRM